MAQALPSPLLARTSAPQGAGCFVSERYADTIATTVVLYSPLSTQFTMNHEIDPVTPVEVEETPAEAAPETETPTEPTEEAAA